MCIQVLKSYLETGADILYFDLRVEPAKKTAYHAIQELHGKPKNRKLKEWNLLLKKRAKPPFCWLL